MQILEWAEVSSVGNQRLSRVSIRRKTTSCDWMRVSMVSTSLRAFAIAFAELRREREGEGERERGCRGREGEGDRAREMERVRERG